MAKTSRLAFAVALAAFLLGLAVLAVASGLAVDALWFAELGYSSVFRKALTARVATFAIAFLVSFAGFATVALTALRATPPPRPIRVVLRRGDGNVTIPELIAPVADRIPWRGVVIAASALLALLVGVAQVANWQTVLLWLHGGEIGEVDPFFGRDLGFYLFTMPAVRWLIGSATTGIVLAALLTGAIFWLRGMLSARDPQELLSPPVVRFASALLGLFFAIKVADYWLSRYELLLERDGAVYGVGYAAAAIEVPLLWLSALVALAACGLSFANVAVAGLRLPAAAAIAVFACSTISSILPGLYHRFWVRPDELRLERPYLENSIAMTRRAYGLDGIKSRPFPAAGELDPAAIERNRETFANIRLWDPGPLLASYKQLQVIRLYYDFHDVDIDRYDLTTGRRQVMLAAREIIPEQLPAAARTWVNTRLKFTHGFGAAMSPVNEFDSEGLPQFYLKDIPPRSSVGLEITEPRIYYGEESGEYAVVGTETDEFDYPKGDENVANRYAGEGGVALGGWLRRILFSWFLGDVNLLISTNIGPESRLMIRRSIRERISRIAPFLLLDRDPYLVVSAGRLFWMQDAYTTSRTYPYSEPVPGLGVNYMRNSVKIVVDAYHGDVQFYAVDPAEPVLAATARIFPGFFRPYAEMPADLRRHVRYPEDLFLVQAEMYRTYHMTNPDVFYNREDLWGFPSETFDGSTVPVEPYYVNMKIPGGEVTEFILMQPMTPANRSNMVAWLAARCDPEHYGELVEFQFPKERLVYGPSQIEARIDQDTTISQQISLWNQMGSKVIRGNLLVIPVEESILYVEPLYLRSEKGQIPELKRVIVAHGDRIAMEPALDKALAAVFHGGAVAPAAVVPRQGEPEAGAPPAGRGAKEHYRAALDALRGGDWGRFGQEMEALGRTLEEE